MVSSEEKRKCIEDVIELSSNEETKSIALKNLYQVLLKDTLNGKLYKYRSFDDKGYRSPLFYYVKYIIINGFFQ